MEGLGILEREGKQAALDYLLRRKNTPGRLLKRPAIPGHQWRTGNYIMFYDPYSPHIGLLEIL